MMNPNITTRVSHAYLTINGTQIHVAQVGKGKPLLLLHGWPQHWYIWRKIIPLLKHKYRLIMPDLPGLGWSEMPKGKDFRKETLAKDIIQLVETLQLKEVGLVGHDWGGWIGFLACLERPDLFSKYLALGITYPFKTPKLLTGNNWRFFYQIPIALPFIGPQLISNPRLIAWGIKQCAFKKEAWTQKDLHWYSSVLQNPQRAEASSLLYREFLMKELLPLSQGIYKNKQFKIPTVLLIGKNDPIINRVFFQDFKEKMVQLKYVEDCGHFIPEEQSERVAKEIEELFS